MASSTATPQPVATNVDDFMDKLANQVSRPDAHPDAVGVYNAIKSKSQELNRPLTDPEIIQVVSAQPIGKMFKFTDAPVAATAAPPPATTKPTGPFDPWHPERGNDPRKEATPGSIAGGVWDTLTTPLTSQFSNGKVSLGAGVRAAAGQPTSTAGRFAKEAAGQAADMADSVQTPLGLLTLGASPVIAAFLKNSPKARALLALGSSVPVTNDVLSGSFDSPEGAAKTAADAVTAGAGGMLSWMPGTISDFVSKYLPGATPKAAVQEDLTNVGRAATEAANGKPLRPPVIQGPQWQAPPPPTDIPPAPASPRRAPVVPPIAGKPTALAVQETPRSVASGAAPSSGPYPMPGSPQGKVEGTPPRALIEAGPSGYRPDPRAMPAFDPIDHPQSEEIGKRWGVAASDVREYSTHPTQDIIDTSNALRQQAARLGRKAQQGMAAEQHPAAIKEMLDAANAMTDIVLRRASPRTATPPGVR